VTSGTLVIWSLSCLDYGTYMPFSKKFVQSVGSGMNCQWYGTLKEINKIPRVLIVIIV